MFSQSPALGLWMIQRLPFGWSRRNPPSSHTTAVLALLRSQASLELSVALESHMRCIFLSARSFRTSCMSCRQQRPHFRNSRNRKPSIAFVRASASWAALWTQYGVIPELRWLLITSASSKVLCSWHWGVVFLAKTSNKDLQSMTANPCATSPQTFSGSFHSIWYWAIWSIPMLNATNWEGPQLMTERKSLRPMYLQRLHRFSRVPDKGTG